ncbi:peroxisome biogenesis protein 6-like [Lactuca sativa]|uniref:peroxisome biogenesis protein 6-like n=1 Tax=Lactuca sativa TaxID=4236 RepID=UPI0022AF3871|nr:peroxisome biogenesis protein 6-like [Lactuca sativa]
MVGQTFGFMPRDIRALVADDSSSLIPINGSSFEKLGDSKEFMVKALERSKKRNASALGNPKVPNVKWEDVGGLEDVKKIYS